jgi:hypothetical protein
MNTRLISAIPALGGLALAFALSATPAAAQNNACVNLLVKAGYAAKMRVVWPGGQTDWSGSFAIGQAKCASLSGVPSGATFSTELKALLGRTITCSPSDVVYNPSVPQNVVYNAWGTTLSPKCEQPN